MSFIAEHEMRALHDQERQIETTLTDTRTSHG
jgi:hypothetical protein